MLSFRHQEYLMTIRYVSGDLFTNRYDAEAFAHGCNCKGAMGAGIAKGFRERYPEMHEEYRRNCRAEPRRFNPGDSFLWKDDDKPWVFNLATQEDYWHSRATCGAIEKALQTMRRQADDEGIRSIAMPRIGAGYGRLPWEKVRPVIERVFSDWAGMVYVYEEHVPGG
jgi:O-acetyl-ADP-ribose deacetylase (regulator of RNase III)